MLPPSRRDFIKVTSAGFAAVLLPQTATAQESSRVAETSVAELNSPQQPYELMSETEIIQTYAFELPDTPWRRAWNEAYHKHGITLESGGERIVNGNVLFFLNHPLSGEICHLSCSEILRRGGDVWNESHKPISVTPQGYWSDIDEMLASGFYPVREPEDFDVVVYGDVVKKGDTLSFSKGHSGLYKDGKVISKDLLSKHVYKHPLEESAAYSSHVMYFRHKTHPDPRDYPLPEATWHMYFVDVDGVAMPVISPRFYAAIGFMIAKNMTMAGLVMGLTKDICRTVIPKNRNSSAPQSEKQ